MRSVPFLLSIWFSYSARKTNKILKISVQNTKNKAIKIFVQYFNNQNDHIQKFSIEICRDVHLGKRRDL